MRCEKTLTADNSLENLKESTFSTKTGSCSVTAERITLQRAGTADHTSQTTAGNIIRRFVSLYTLLGILALVYGIWAMVIEGNFLAGVIFILLGAYFLRGILLSRNNKARDIIERSSVQSVEAHPPVPFLTDAYFSVHLVDNGKKARREIRLPGSFSAGEKEYKKASAILQEMGWLQY